MAPKLFFNWDSNSSSARRSTGAFLWICTLAYIGLFVASLFLSSWQLAPIRSNPLLGPDRDVLVKLGATVTYKISENNQWWRLISSSFLCAGTLQLWATTSALWTFGLFLATALAPWQLITVFVTSLVAGVAWSASLASNYVTSAASGPVFGLIGGTCATLVLHWRVFRNHIVSFLMLMLVLALNLFMGATPFVDNSCNVIAFLVGTVASLSMLLLNRETTSNKGRELVLRGMVILLLGACVLAALIGLLLLTMSNPPLRNCCDKWVCVPSKLWDCDAAHVDQRCTFTRYNNGTIQMSCPMGAGRSWVPQGLSDDGMLALCDSTCNGVVSTPGQSPSPSRGGNSGGTKQVGTM